MFLLIGLVACNSESNDTDKDSEQTAEAKDEFQELKIAYSAQPDLLDPHVTSSVQTNDIMRHVYETLITVNENNEPKPNLADSWEISDDELTYTFHLREGVTFQNEKEMTAEDVVASMNRWKNLQGGRETFIDASFKEKDDYTVELILPEPLSITLTSLSYMGPGIPAIMPKEIIDDASPDGVEEYVGTGPYVMEEWKQDQYILLTPYVDYKSRTEEPDGLFGKKEAFLDEIRFQFVEDPSTRVAGIQSGEYSFAHAVPYDNAEQIENIPELNSYVYEGGFLMAHFNKDQGLFADKKARQAVLATINVEDALKPAYTSDTYYMLNDSLMMPSQQTTWYSDKSTELYNQKDSEKAKQLLGETEYDGEEIKIIASRDFDDHYQGGIILQDQLEKLGMNVKLEVYDWPTLLEKIYEKDVYDIFMMGNVKEAEPTALGYLDSSTGGWFDAEAPELDKLVDELRSKTANEELQPVFDEMQEWFYDYVPAIRFGDFNRIATQVDTIDKFQYQDGLYFWNVSNNE